ncbi:Lrp/AsnC family transcriptional regulator [Kangiella sp. TOML190]|uniref:Lrp/AsnC family transcriptional regulator n=1 Tax=Kangiella sp. TOML190 TaxID=2931351 RepID=UPI00203E57B5|nr:Lrp/AsnC family transcriptional regulator [Kangiella sp. TOML190]
MLKSSRENDLDAMDRKILYILQQEGRISNADLAKKIHLSAPATHGRVKRLEQEGFIKGYVALLDRHQVGYDNLCFIELSLQLHRHHQIQSILETIMSWPEVLECHNVTGEYDYLLKVAVKNTRALEQFNSKKLIPLEGVAKIHTSLVLKEVKATTAIDVN